MVGMAGRWRSVALASLWMWRPRIHNLDAEAAEPVGVRPPADDSPSGETMSEDDVMLQERRGPVAVLTLNRPEKRNALNGQLRCAFLGAMDAVARDREVRAVVITGAGGKSFVAGADVTEFEGRSPVDQYRVAKAPTLHEAIERLPKPVIAAVNGYCLGGGMELALACDVRIAAESATFGQPEINLAIIPGGGATQRLPRIVGLGAALKLILGGEHIDAAEALRIRLVDEVVPAGELLDRAIAFATRLAAKSPVAMAAAKEATRAALSLPLSEGLKLETALFQLCFSSDDKVEGIRAFLEKRAPTFTGR
jgi:enoyl-CoA hydratase